MSYAWKDVLFKDEASILWLELVMFARFAFNVQAEKEFGRGGSRRLAT